MSQAPYFWPDPAKPDGRPYIRKDGERNPEIDRITDHRAIDGLSNAQTLGLAFYFGGDERYAEKAATLLRVFFLDPATRMNPNLEYAQYIPGVNTGRGIGLIETRGLTRVADTVRLLDTTRAWTADDDRDVKAWFASFLHWMQTSPNGRAESRSKNNHGTYYDLQVAVYALFVDRPLLARQVFEAAKQTRIGFQIEPDGRQPLELARTRAWSYSVMNLDGLTALASVGERAGVDLWHYRTADGRSIRAALLYLAPYAFGPPPVWPYRQLGGFNGAALFPVLRRAAARYHDGDVRSVAAKLPRIAARDRSMFY
jgi:hypothetical protein